MTKEVAITHLSFLVKNQKESVYDVAYDTIVNELRMISNKGDDRAEIAQPKFNKKTAMTLLDVVKTYPEEVVKQIENFTRFISFYKNDVKVKVMKNKDEDVYKIDIPDNKRVVLNYSCVPPKSVIVIGFNKEGDPTEPQATHELELLVKEYKER